MKAFFGGRIKEDCRGDLAVVVKREQEDPKEKKTYEAYLCPVISDEFVGLTGVRDTKCQVERVYMGVSREVGNEVVGMVSMNNANLDLDTLDVLVVTPYFLKRD